MKERSKTMWVVVNLMACIIGISPIVLAHFAGDDAIRMVGIVITLAASASSMSYVILNRRV